MIFTLFLFFFFFFFNDTATTEIYTRPYTLSLHDALPISGMIGVFVSLDFFLFYVFWEVMLVPMYFLIGIWGGENRLYAAIKFFLYTLVGSVVMLLAILKLYFMVPELAHAHANELNTWITQQFSANP